MIKLSSNRGILLTCYTNFWQIKLDIVPDKSWQTDDMFIPAGYHMNSHISSEDSAPKEVGEPPYTYPAGVGNVLMNGCWGTGYQEGDPCYAARWKLEARLVW